MEIVYGTGNLSKLSFMREQLEGLEVTIVGLSEIVHDVSEPEETGSNPSDNAYIKALGYYRQLKRPVMSADSGLFFEGVKDSDQPGVFIKRLQGKEMNGPEMVQYYSDLASQYGGKIRAHYKNALCVVVDENHIFRIEDNALDSERFYIVDTPHERYEKGFPLNCLSVDVGTMTYYYDLQEVKDKYERTGFNQNMRSFIEAVLASVCDLT